MKSWKKYALILALASSTFAGCGKGGIDSAQAPAPQPGVKEEGQPAVRDYSKNTVAGCSGSAGTSAGAKSAFDANDFATCNSQASCAFNASVASSPEKPDADAAFYGFLCKTALLIESPQFEQITLEKWKAADYFNKVDVAKEISLKLTTKFPGNKLDFFHTYFKAQADAGHSVEDTAQAFGDFFLENLMDLHILAKAMAQMPSLNTLIPKKFFGVTTDWPVTVTEASIIDTDIMMLMVAGELLKVYNLGISSPDSFADQATLMNDLNTSPRILSLRDKANGANLKSATHELTQSGITASGWVSLAVNRGPDTDPAPDKYCFDFQYKVADWVKDGGLFPLHGEIQPFQLGLFAAQLNQSLDNHFVFFTATGDNKEAFNIGKLVDNLPNSDKVAGNPLELKGTDVQPSEDFLKAFLKDYYIEK